MWTQQQVIEKIINAELWKFWNILFGGGGANQEKHQENSSFRKL